MANNTFALYLPSPLYDDVLAAQERGDFKVKDVCARALIERLQQSGVVPNLSNAEDAQALADDATAIEYVLQFKPDLASAQAMIDNVRDQGGWPISHSLDGAGISLLFAYPKALDEDHPAQ